MVDTDDQRDRLGGDVLAAWKILVVDVVAVGSGILEVETGRKNRQKLWTGGDVQNAILHGGTDWTSPDAYHQGGQRERIGSR